MHIRRSISLALPLVAAALAGCAALAPTSPEQIVQQRATQYWEARIAGRPDTAYALSTPSYRKLRTEAQFRQQFGAAANVNGADVADVTCVEARCTAKIKILVTPALLGIKTGAVATYMDEIWLLEDGQWWHYQEP